MKAKITMGQITIDLHDLVESLTPDDRVTLARHLAAEEHLFAAVLECVASESSMGSFFQDSHEGEWWFDSRTTLELRTKLAPLMPAIARRAVETALQQRDAAEADARRHQAWAYKLYHAWPESYWRQRPQGPDGWQPTPTPTKEVIDAFMTQPSADSGGDDT